MHDSQNRLRSEKPLRPYALTPLPFAFAFDYAFDFAVGLLLVAFTFAYMNFKYFFAQLYL